MRKPFALRKTQSILAGQISNDPDFRDQVDQAYKELLRDHSDRAYDKNVTRDSYIKTVHEDNWRVHVNLYDNLGAGPHQSYRAAARSGRLGQAVCI
jgi:hypothetical protein